MVEVYVGPSELHLKKELTTLQKAQCLRDPKTCSSWKSPLRSKSFCTSPGLKYLDGIRGDSTGVNRSGGFLEIPSKRDNRRKVYLYNWRHNSNKSSDHGIQLDEDDRISSVEGTSGDIHSAGCKSFASVQRSARKLERIDISKQRFVKNPDVSELLDPPSNSFGVEHPDDTEEFNSEYTRQLKHDTTAKNVASPLFSGSKCANWSYSSKILRSTRRQESPHSYTPASTSSYYRYGGGNPSTVGSWDETAGSLDGDDSESLDLPRKTKGKGCRGCYSPSLSDILRRKGTSFLCGSRMLYNKKRSSSSSYIKNHMSQDLPLLTNSGDGSDSLIDTTSDELSVNINELEMEALSRLNGRRWSTCKSQEGSELARHVDFDLDMSDHRSLSQYRPRSFDDIVGQNIVVNSLSNAIKRGRIAPAYLFHGPRGTGKTSTARIFAAALNCLSTNGKRPCGVCGECTHFSNGNSSHFREVDATDRKGLERVRYLLKNILMATKVSQYNVFVIDQCHVLSTKMWSAFMKFLENPPPRVVFIFVTVDLENLSRAIVSRSQKYLFSKVKDSDIMNRLRKISSEENIDVESDALLLIAVNSDGSIQDAETMLDQLSLLGKRITTSLVNDLVGVVSDEKLLDLLEIAMSSNTVETVKRSRELMDSGIDPMTLMSQLAGLIMDIIAGTYRLATSQRSGMVLGGRINEAELERLQAALKILSDAEKQLKFSSERSTWFTAALLQLGSAHNVDPTRSSCSSKHSNKKMEDFVFDTTVGTSSLKFHEPNLGLIPRVTQRNCSPHGCTSYRPDNEILTSDQGATGKRLFRCVNPDKLAEIWKRCIENCHSRTLRQLLFAHGKLSSITEIEDALIALIEFKDLNVKTRAERYLSSITNSIELVLKHNVEVRIGLVTINCTNGLTKSMPRSAAHSHTESVGVSKDRKFESFDKEAKGFNEANYPLFSTKGYDGSNGTTERGKIISVLRANSVATDEQRVETREKTDSGPENHIGSSMGLDTKHVKNEVNYEFEAQDHNLSQTGGKVDHYVISPSILHSRENMGYESGPGCNGLFCWNTRKSHREKVKQGTHVKSQKTVTFSIFGQCGKPKTPESSRPGKCSN